MLKICMISNEAGTTRHFDRYQRESYIVTADGIWIGYDDVESINNKVLIFFITLSQLYIFDIKSIFPR